MNVALWNTLLKTQFFSANEVDHIQKWIRSGEATKLTMSTLIQLQGVFIQLSHYRMEVLSKIQQLSPLPREYFETNDLEHAWKQLHSVYKCSKEELKDASFINNLLVNVWDRSINDREKVIFVRTFEQFISRVFDFSSMELTTVERERESTAIKKEGSAIQQEEFLGYKESRKLEFYSKKEPYIKTQLVDSRVKPTSFIEQLSTLQTSSVESVVHADEFTTLQQYMHVERPIQNYFLQSLEHAQTTDGPSLIMLCGSVGDGKSHLISYIQEMRPDLLEGFYVHNDSTESHNPGEDEIETLERVLAGFEQNSQGSNRIILAINLGVLHNFYVKHRHTSHFPEIVEAIETSSIFEMDQDISQSIENITFLNFASLQPYNLDETGVTSPFFKAIIEKITAPVEENPFYQSWKADKERGIWTPVHLNYSLLQDEKMRDAVVQVLIEAMIVEKLFLSTRALYNVIYDMLVPLDIGMFHPNHLLPNLLFSRPERSDLMQALHTIDPVARREEVFDELLRQLVVTDDRPSLVKQYITSYEAYTQLFERVEEDVESYSKLLIRHYYLLNHQTLNKSYHEFLQTLYSYYTGSNESYEKLFQVILKAVERWIGSPKEHYIYIDAVSESAYQLAIPFEFEAIPGREYGKSAGIERVNRLRPEIEIGLNVNDSLLYMTIDYALFKLLVCVSEGYRPTRQDYAEALQFVEFYNAIVQHTDKSKEVLIVHPATEQMIRMKKPLFGIGKKKYEVESMK